MDIITSDGEYLVNTIHHEIPGGSVRMISKTILLVSGSLGGGIATLGYKDRSSTFIPIKDDTNSDVTLQVGNQYQINHGEYLNLYISLSGSSTPSLDVIVKGIHQ